MTSVRLASTRAELAELLAGARGTGTDGSAAPVGLVPTMGALHDGHASLVRLARDRVAGGPVVVSVFVNPLQFGAGEDLDRYPRTLDADLEVCAAAGADVVFAPSVEEVYPSWPVPPQVTVAPGPLAERLEGSTRPGHFGGMLTVVAKLFGLVRPDLAVFGEKDYQQLVLIRRMVADLCLGVEVVGAETRRDPDGLAMSSRNRYLTAEQREAALALGRALRAAQQRASYGVPAARWAAMDVLRAEPGIELDYLALTTTGLDELPDYPEQPTEGRILVAAKVGTTRLIDNLPLHLADHATPQTPDRPQSPAASAAGATHEGDS
ncbi:pantoate--beta-alanine ligase [Nocardioides sambongensis]|uniref:pantoate--beta-alanine ligase n=1 Tax=Nocardioides sambongensis TaxID=2589074 RepID=UPI00112EF16D|nr:pantoate--beta-alanine ligase [Nocardioides sambongensis]